MNSFEYNFVETANAYLTFLSNLADRANAEILENSGPQSAEP